MPVTKPRLETDTIASSSDMPVRKTNPAGPHPLHAKDKCRGSIGFISDSRALLLWGGVSKTLGGFPKPVGKIGIVEKASKIRIAYEHEFHLSESASPFWAHNSCFQIPPACFSSSLFQLLRVTSVGGHFQKHVIKRCWTPPGNQSNTLWPACQLYTNKTMHHSVFCSKGQWMQWH